MNTLNAEWLRTCRLIVDRGEKASPRGLDILEVPHHAVAVDMERSVLTLPGRDLGHRFMAAEAHWVLSGSDRLADILPYSRRMADFSDDGATLAGAYGPRIAGQLDWVVAKLLADSDTRQATMTLWTPLPAPSRDIPCTVALDFKVRSGKLHLHAFMRSSDAWLGLPYDCFTFSMVALAVALDHNGAIKRDIRASRPYVGLGTLYLTAASSHLYLPDARRFGEAGPGAWEAPDPPGLPDELARLSRSSQMAYLRLLRDAREGNVLRWWEWGR